MTFKFHCTCGQKVSATSDMIGTRATCPRCGASVKVPKPEDALVPPTAEPHSQPPKETSDPAQKSSPPLPAPESSRQEAAKAPLDKPALPQEAAETPTIVTPAPLKIVARPTSLLWTVASASATLAIGATAFLAWNLGDRIPKSAGLALAAIIVGLVLGAILLRQFIRLFLKFDPGFSEAMPMTLLAGSLTTLSLLPAGLSLSGKIAPELAARLLPATIGIAVLLIVAAYGFLIRNALGRPVGIGRGALAGLLQAVSVGAFLAIVWGVTKLVLSRA